MSDDFGHILRRSLVAVATTTYTAPDLPELAGVADEVQAIQAWLSDDQLGPRRFTPIFPELAKNPSVRQVEDALKRPDRDWNDGDAAVVYVSGHGLRTTDGHWIALHDTDVSSPRRTAIATRELIGWLHETSIDHLLVILDLCHAGAAGFDAVRLPDFPPTWIGIASTSPDTTATTGALTGAIRGFLEELARPEGARFDHGPYLRVEDFLTEVAARLPGQRLHYLHTARPDGGPSPCLPNPRHTDTAELVERSRRDLAIRADDLKYWVERARGSDVGWMFTGRVALMHALIEFLRDPPSVVVVTGGAGTGKSAVLGRLVTLTDPRFRADHPDLLAAIPADLQPDEGCVDAAVLATGKLSHEVLAQILEALAVPVNGSSVPTLAELTAHWTTWIAARTTSITIVIDALDEAKNPAALLDEVLRPLTAGLAQDSVRLLVGVRGPGTDPDHDIAAGPTVAGHTLADRVVTTLHARRLAVDEDPWWQPHDLADYALDILQRTPGSPYAAPQWQNLAQRVAAIIADHARRSFLIARLAASTRADAPNVIDPDDPSWRRTLDDGVLGVFRDDLHSAYPRPEDRLRAIHLLRAVAFAYGRGLPWSQIWPLVANAVADRPGTYGDTDIAGLLASRLGGYLVTDQEDGITVYRLFHDALRTTLRERWRELLDDAP